MSRTEYESSAIKSASYDFEKRELEIEFRNGGVYRYADVPPEEAEAFAASSSKGGHFQSYIRDAYQTVRVPEEDVESFPFPEPVNGTVAVQDDVFLEAQKQLNEASRVAHAKLQAVEDKAFVDALKHPVKSKFDELLTEIRSLLSGLELTNEQANALISEVVMRLRGPQ